MSPKKVFIIITFSVVTLITLGALGYFKYNVIPTVGPGWEATGHCWEGNGTGNFVAKSKEACKKDCEANPKCIGFNVVINPNSGEEGCNFWQAISRPKPNKLCKEIVCVRYCGPKPI